MSDYDAFAPLLQPSPEEAEELYPRQSCLDGAGYGLRRMKRDCQHLLESRAKHYFIMGVVALDVAVLLANVFLQLIACETHQTHEHWVERLSEDLEIASLAFGFIFLLELAACLFAFGFGYLASWFHLLDSVVILASLAIDIFSKGLTESIGSLIVVLRLWRLAKISEEIVLGAQERIEMLEDEVQELKAENSRLRVQAGDC